VLEISKFTVRLTVIAQARTTCLNRFRQYITDQWNESSNPLCRNPARLFTGINSGAVQHFADINVPKTRDDPLIQQCRFNRSRA
jgi:hypothetical protein